MPDAVLPLDLPMPDFNAGFSDTSAHAVPDSHAHNPTGSHTLDAILKSSEYALDIFSAGEIAALEVFDKMGKPSPPKCNPPTPPAKTPPLCWNKPNSAWKR